LIQHGRRRGNVFFLAETLGCRLPQMVQLAGAGFDAFFNSSKWWDFREPWLLDQYESFRRIAPSVAFAESHDTQRLCSELHSQGIHDPWRVEATYRLRYLFSVFFSSNVMMPMGFETGQPRKMDVVHTRPEDMQPPLFDLSAFISAANATKQTLPALTGEGPQRRITAPHAPVVGLLRSMDHGSERCLALINPSADASADIRAEDIVQAAGAGWRVVCDTHLGAVEGSCEPGSTMRLHPLAMRILHANS